MDAPSVPTRQAILDEEHLRLLGIGYWVSAGVHAFGSLIGLLYAGMGIVMGVVFANVPTKAGQEPPPKFFFLIFVFFGLAILAVMVALALLNARAAKCLKARRSRVFCMVMAAFNCLGMPWGTVLGVATFLVLGRASVSAMFEAAPAPAAPAPAAPESEGPPPSP